MKVTAHLHMEEGSYWAEAPEFPGCFASGDTLDELFASLQEGIALHLTEDRTSWRATAISKSPLSSSAEVHPIL